jgi:sporulation protein YlmC with PRC-barrel domain
MCWKSMLHVNNLLGKTVVSAIDTYVGEVYDIAIDPSTWMVMSLQVKLSDKAIETLGLKKILRRKSASIPINVVADIGVIIKLSQSLADLKRYLVVVID